MSQNEEKDLANNVAEMPILNSFYMSDIEKVINSLQEGSATTNIKQYLTIQKEKHSDLYTKDGLDIIKKAIEPKHLPQGRWPSDPNHHMSLMQQFAINTAITQNDQNSLLSVNGPPGTGKTTLIKDIIAHLVTERAKILASHETIDDSIDEQGHLAPALHGFEILVASSNNAAIKNISEELPLLSSIHESFGELNYLKKVAEFMVAKEESKDNADKYKRYYTPLDDHESRWGLIAATLGKCYNKQHFSKRVFFNKAYQYPAGKNDEKINHPDFLSLWQWYKAEKPKSFKEAQRAFKVKIKLLEKHIDKLDDYYHLNTTCHVLKKKIAKRYDLPLLLKASSEKETFNQLEKVEALAMIDLNVTLTRIEAIKLSSPNILHCFFKTKAFKKYLEKLALVLELSSNIYKKIKSLKKLKDTIKQIIAIQKQYPDMRIPKIDDSIYDTSLQKSGYWQNKTINTLRSEIFIEALNLHQSWLHQALNISRFRQNILKIPSALNNTIKKEDAQHIWQILFMITPVVTSTFASVTNMLQHIKQDELGWLFIDEAGQALPQAAIGSIHRCKHTLAVGDPLQIEPVLTTPPSLINKICNDHLSNRSEEWSPLRTSVQLVIDRASSYGCTLEINNAPSWIGIPLWVHRRCIEPMFSLSNQIAYNSRMIHALNKKAIEPQLLNNRCQNAWINSIGECNDKQFKPELIDDLFELLNILNESGVNPSTIYIITPFKAVLNHLHSHIKQPTLNDNLGTIHTFQGKENDTVILVLGCCPKNSGGASWAASTPNILNVAITRAKRNVFILGDLAVWSDKPYFSNLSNCVHNYQSLHEYKCSLDPHCNSSQADAAYIDAPASL